MKSVFVQLIFAVVVCIAAVAGYAVWRGTVASLSAAAAVLQDKIDAKTDTANRVATARFALAEIVGDEVAVRNYFVSETGIVAFIDDLEALGRATGNTTVGVLSVSTGDTNTHTAFKFALSVKGTFDGVMRTIGVIEYAPYAISVSSLSVVKNAKNDWHANFVFLAGSVTSAPAKTP